VAGGKCIGVLKRVFSYLGACFSGFVDRTEIFPCCGLDKALPSAGFHNRERGIQLTDNPGADKAEKE
jgi:hypothetical protein